MSYVEDKLKRVNEAAQMAVDYFSNKEEYKKKYVFDVDPGFEGRPFPFVHVSNKTYIEEKEWSLTLKTHDDWKSYRCCTTAEEFKEAIQEAIDWIEDGGDPREVRYKEAIIDLPRALKSM